MDWCLSKGCLLVILKYPEVWIFRLALGILEDTPSHHPLKKRQFIQAKSKRTRCFRKRAVFK